MLSKRSAFTIVELLIVIVVIGILATIAIVAYNGIQDRARVSSVSSALNQAAKKIALWQVDNPSSSPTDLASVGVSNSSDVSYQYTAGTNGAYCITATNGTTSYYLNTTTATKPTTGGCAGHGVGGVGAVTNLSTNPRAISAGAGWASNNGTIYPVTKGVAISGHPLSISTAARSQLLTGQISTCILSINSVDTLGNSTTQRSVGAWVMTNGSDFQARMAGAGLPTVWTALTPNVWSYIQSPGGATGYMSLYICKVSGNAAETDIGYATGSIAVAGTASYNFADGYSANWVWNGAVNNSTSTGPPL